MAKKENEQVINTLETVEETVEGTVDVVEETAEDRQTAAAFDAESKKWGKELAKEKKVKIKIKPKSKDDTSPVPVGVNGYFYWINKNESVEVPETVARILEEADYI